MDNAQRHTDPMFVPMVFLRIGWMERYQGLTVGDAITGGGAFVAEQGYGHEICNFADHSGLVYGYARPPRGSGDELLAPRLNINRLGASSHDDKVEGILALWVASSPDTHENVIVGWYKNATVYRNSQIPSNDSGRTYKGNVLDFYVTARSEDSYLLPRDERLFQVPRGSGGMGQANVWYSDDQNLHSAFRQSVLEYVQTRELPRRKPDESDLPPRQPDPLLRARVEQAAISTTTDYYRRLSYIVDSKEQDNVGWDLEAVRDRTKLLLEVKGLSGSHLVIELTPNEYAKMQEHRDSYRICVVTNALTAPQLAIFSFSRDTGRWEDQDRGRPLHIAEQVAARCTV